MTAQMTEQVSQQMTPPTAAQDVTRVACAPESAPPCAIAHVSRPHAPHAPRIDAVVEPVPAAAPATPAPETPSQGAMEAGSAVLSPPPPQPGTGVASPKGARASRRPPEVDDEEGQVGWLTCSPERPVMEILFRCIEAGRRYYAVRLNGQEIFIGTRSECDRFLAIHNEKVATEQAEARKTPRGRPAALHIYRTARA
jgi:hypothetical protein